MKYCFILALALLGLPSYAQITYAPLYDGSTFTAKQIDPTKAVGVTLGSAGVSGTGAATYSIPIWCPPGTNGMTPAISLVYNSQAGNGIMGMGWNISGLSAISRVGKDIYHDGEVAPVDFSTHDNFALDGVRMIVRNGTHGNNGCEYALEAEDFSIITYYKSGSDDYFTVRKKDGTVYEYGATEDSRLRNNGNTAVMLWRLNKITDINHNYIEFTYSKNESTRRSYIAEIRYTGNDLNSVGPQFKIKFNTIAGRVEKATLYEAGASVNQVFILESVHITDENDNPLKKYQLQYGNDGVNSFLTTITEKNQQNEELNSTIFKYGDSSGFTIRTDYVNGAATYYGQFTAADMDGDGVQELISLDQHADQYGAYISGFSIYNNYRSDNNTYSTTAAIDYGASRNFKYKNVEYRQDKTVLNKFDWNGDGLEDILTVNAQFQVNSTNHYYDIGDFNIYLGQDNNNSLIQSSPVQFNAYTNTPWSGTNFTDQMQPDNHESIFQGDFDGDKKSDIFMIYCSVAPHDMHYHTPVIYSSSGDPVSVTGINFSEWGYGNNYPYNHFWKFQVLDFDGDGKNELMMMGDQAFYIYTFTKQPSGSIAATKIHQGGYPTRWHEIYPADFNGDGKTDLLTKTDNNSLWEIAMSTGTGFIVSPFYFAHHPVPKYSNSDGSYDRVRIGDFNGDGKTDIFQIYGTIPQEQYPQNAIISIYYSHGNNYSFHRADYNWNANGKLIGEGIVADMDGDGKASYCIGLQGSLITLSFAKGGQANLLEKVKDGSGKEAHFQYSPLTSFNNYLTNPYQKGSGASHPLFDVENPLYVVDKIHESNGQANQLLTANFNYTKYKYEGALFHGTGRGFLGFKKITAETPATNSKTEVVNDINPTYYMPYVKETKTYNTATSQQISQTTNTLSFVPGSVPGSFYQQLLSQTEQNLLSGATTTTTNTYNNSYGTISSSTTDISGAETITTATTYTQPGTTSIPCMPNEVTVTRTRAGQPAAADKTKFEYDGVGRISGKRERYGNINGLYHTYGYDTYGNLTATAVSNGLSSSAPNTVSYQYTYSTDGRFRESSTQVEMNQTSYTTWHPVWGKPLTETDINGIVTTYAYNNWGKLITAKYKTGTAQEETVTYSDGWDVNGAQCYYTLSSHPAKPDVKTWFDKLGRTLKTRTEHLNGLWTESTVAYDLRGNVTETVAPRLSSEPVVKTTTTYDAFNRVSTVTAATGGTTTGNLTYAYTFPGSGRLQTRVTNSSMQESTILTDAAGKKIESADHGGKLAYTYNSRGDLLTVKHGLIMLLTHSYNSLGVKTQTVDVSTGLTKYIYDAFGRLKSETDANNKTHTFQYNELGQITQRTGPEGTTAYTYYPTGSGYANQLASVTGFNGVNDYFYYDHLGRLTQKDKDILGDVYTTSYTYDNYDNLVRKDYSDGFQLNYTYSNGLLTKVGFPSSHPNNYYFNAAGINGQGQYTQYTLANGKQTTNTYTNGYLTSTATPGVQDLEMDYNYTTGNLLYRKDRARNLVEDFQYDDLNRLTKSTVTDYNQSVVHPSIDIHYDASGNGTAAISRGNIIAKTDIGNYGYGGTRAASVQNTQTLISEKDQDITYTPFRKTETVTEEDANGNLYDQTFTYDAGYDRVMTILSQGGNQLKIRHYLDDYEVNISPTTGVKTFVHYVAGGDGLCAIVSFNTSFVPVLAYASCKPVYKDHLGSIVAATDFYGAMVAEQNFDAWGRERNPDDWTYDNVTGVGLAQSWLYRGYTGHEHMPHFSIINMNGRMYDPLLGRMMSPDIYLHGGTQGMNRYTYCFNNPLAYIDPSGDIALFAMPYVSYNPDIGWDVGLSAGIGFGINGVGVGVFVNAGYSTQNNWSFGVGVFAGINQMVGASASVNYNVVNGWSAYAGVGLNIYDVSNYNSNVTTAGVGWSQQAGFYASAAGFTYSSYGLTWGIDLGYSGFYGKAWGNEALDFSPGTGEPGDLPEVTVVGVRNTNNNRFAAALPIALTAALADGPLPVGDAVAVGILVGTTGVYLYDESRGLLVNGMTAMADWMSELYSEFAAEHKKNARPSTKGKHEKGQSRKTKDRDGGKGMKYYPRKRPNGWNGKWPPK
ncbi:MAG TPA: FG-GAP-like repeat-containing protein [Flavipsychrobacter sp.]|nr:FG-GAP-like repeat-containing protein [Flavipsychrobacter sp.]